MAITDTKQAKDFAAGAPRITLKGDLRPNQMMAGSSRYQMILEELINEMEDRLGRPITNEEYDQLGREAYDRLFESSVSKEKNQMMASGPDLTDSRNELALELFGKELRLLTEEEMDILNDEAERLTQKFMADGGRAQYGLGSIVKGVKKAVKGVAKGVKNVVKSDVGKAAIAAYFLGGGNLGGMLKGRPGFSFANLPGAGLFTEGGIFSNPLNLKEGADFMNTLKIGGAGAIITGLLAKREQQPGESDVDFAERRAQVNDQLNVQFKRLYPKGEAESDQDYEVRINAMVEQADDSTVPVGEMAAGGRVGYAMGSDDKVEMAAGIEGLPINVNPKGVKELDLRETGGFIPPVGVKEKADDIPAMLSNNEFVFTADAVRAAGGGSVNKGAQRLYDTMKQLESKVV